MGGAVVVDEKLEGSRNGRAFRHEDTGAVLGNIEDGAVDCRCRVCRDDLRRFERQMSLASADLGHGGRQVQFRINLRRSIMMSG